MAMMLSPFDLGAPVSPISRSVVQALLAKHGVSSPRGASPVRSAMPSEQGDLIGKPQLDIPPDLAVDTGAPGAADRMIAAAPTLSASDASVPTIKGPGMMSRIGDFLKSDEGRAALLRSGAATLQGGLGAGIQAGADFVDRRRAQAAAAAQNATENALRTKQLDNTYNLGLGRLDVDQQGADETGRSHRANEGIERSRIGADVYKHDNPSGDVRVRTAEDRYEHITPSGTTQATEAGANYRHDNPSADATAQNQTTIAAARIGHPEPHNTMQLRYQATPETLGAKHAAAVAAARPSQVRPGMANPVKISGDDDYNALPSGTQFIGPDGQLRTKP